MMSAELLALRHAIAHAGERRLIWLEGEQDDCIVRAESLLWGADVYKRQALLCTGASLNLKALRGGAMLTGWATVNRLCCIPVLLVLGAWALGFSPQALGILFLISSTPTAAASYVMTRAMGGDSALAANIIATTTLGSLVTTSLGATLMNYLGLMG